LDFFHVRRWLIAIVRGSYEQGCAGKLLKAERIKTKYLAMSEKDAAKEIRGLKKICRKRRKIWILNVRLDCAMN